MSETTKVGLAIIGVFVAGFIMVGISKDEPSIAQKEAAAGIRNYVAIQTMASEKCPVLIKKETGEQVFFPSETKSDREVILIVQTLSGLFSIGNVTSVKIFLNILLLH